jgi:hypothetical protein
MNTRKNARSVLVRRLALTNDIIARGFSWCRATVQCTYRSQVAAIAPALGARALTRGIFSVN